ncbi:hypothetical protein LLG96_05160 [bacterium]|nr:hypothetical protein [bacterium]
MLDVAKVAEYGSYSYKRDTRTGKDNPGVNFNDIMTGSGAMPDKPEAPFVRMGKETELAADSPVEVEMYNRSGTIFKYSSYVGVNLDLIA